MGETRSDDARLDLAARRSTDIAWRSTRVFASTSCMRACRPPTHRRARWTRRKQPWRRPVASIPNSQSNGSRSTTAMLFRTACARRGRGGWI